MRILYVGFNAKYINPTSQLLQCLLKLIGDVTFYGPGFSSIEELQGGIGKFYKKQDPFDFVFTSIQLAVVSDPLETRDFYRKYCVTTWGDVNLEAFMLESRQFLLLCSKPRIVFALDLDPYAVQSKLITELDEVADFIVSLGAGFTKPNADLRYLTNERDIAEKAKTIPLGLWHDYCQTHTSKFISLGHFVGLDEFYFGPLALRAHSVSVTGKQYFFRKKALLEFMKGRRISVGQSSYRWIFSLLSRLGVSPYSRLVSHEIYRTLFKKLLLSSKISFTDGGAYDYMIRKFVEIPASGALLLARKCAGFDSLGFVDGESAVVINESDVLGQVVALLEDSSRIQQIALRGQSIVWEKHSLQARASQLTSALRAISGGDFRGSTWDRGEFVLL